jgi:hypothetical protein
MSAMREKDAADYDLERFIEMFDEAMVSNDPRVKNALRQLMMMVILTDTGDHEGQRRASHGPLRRMYEDVHVVNRKLSDIESQISNLKYGLAQNQTSSDPKQWPPTSAKDLYPYNFKGAIEGFRRKGD